MNRFQSRYLTDEAERDGLVEYPPESDITTEAGLQTAIKRILWGKNREVFSDVHTHLFPPQAGKLFLSGIHELFKYHYVQREVLRYRRDISATQFFEMEDDTRTRMVWSTFFAPSATSQYGTMPVSEGMRAILTILDAFGQDVNAKTPDQAIDFFASRDPQKHFEEILRLAGLSSVVGTNDPFNLDELTFYKDHRNLWHPGVQTALRLDTLVLKPEQAALFANEHFGLGISIADGLNASNIAKWKRFVRAILESNLNRETLYGICNLPNPLYVGISFPPDFSWVESSDNPRLKMLEEVIIPVCAELGKPIFPMLGPIRGVVPKMRNAGDTMGQVNLTGFPEFLARHPEVDFYVTTLDRSTQAQLHAYCCSMVHVIVWSCWWFQHQPGTIVDLTNDRYETLGFTFSPFNSDARVPEQLISKWIHFRQDYEGILFTQWSRLIRIGYRFKEADMRRAIRTQFSLKKLNRRSWIQDLQTAI